MADEQSDPLQVISELETLCKAATGESWREGSLGASCFDDNDHAFVAAAVTALPAALEALRMAAAVLESEGYSGSVMRDILRPLDAERAARGGK